ncbi:MAG: hypothetical protein HC896_16015 [Bacteroidales bacterium]|nr:hypothetical protein [Bacteroidales bacterium]
MEKAFRRLLMQGATPTFGQEIFIAENPGDIKAIERIEYLANEDALYLTGEVPDGDWGVIGTKMARYNNWAGGNRTATWVAPLPYGNSVPGFERQKAISFTSNYIYTVGVETRAKVWVFDAYSGQHLGYLEPQAELNGAAATGWVDIPYGIRSITRMSGEEIVLIEDDGFAKILTYRWCPDGDCQESDIQVDLKTPGLGNFFYFDSTVLLTVDILVDTSVIDKVEYYANNVWIGESNEAPLVLRGCQIKNKPLQFMPRPLPNKGTVAPARALLLPLVMVRPI